MELYHRDTHVLKLCIYPSPQQQCQTFVASSPSYFKHTAKAVDARSSIG